MASGPSHHGQSMLIHVGVRGVVAVAFMP
jgi:hypothetical protein